MGCEKDGARFLLAAGFPTRLGDAPYLGTCAARKIFLQSTHDKYGPRAELEKLWPRIAEPKQIVWIEATDHFFGGALPALEEAVVSAVG